MDSYLGTRWPRPPAEVAPLYQTIYSLIFERMRAAGLDWRYSSHTQPSCRCPSHPSLPPEMQALGRTLDEIHHKAAGTPDDPPPVNVAYRSVYEKAPETAI